MTQVAPSERGIFEDIWTTFLANAIGGLREASLAVREKKAEYERRSGWFRTKNRRIPQEEAVSRALADQFKNIKARQTLFGTGVQPNDLRNIDIECETPRPRDPGIGKSAKPTDFQLELLKDGVLDLRIEAKTILSDAEVRMTYLGTEGMLRFEDGTNPYTTSRFGAMVAYVADLDAESWRRKIAVEVATSLGSERTRILPLRGADHQVSQHGLTIDEQEGPRRIVVEVIHFALEIDAMPSLRECS